jgi:hypothetical protein
MHSTDNVDDGYFGSGKRLWFSINYHGKENHDKEILEFLPSRSELKAREKELVNEDVLKDDLCMNLCVGGEGGFISIEGCKRGGENAGILQRNKMENNIVYKTKVINNFIDIVKKTHAKKGYKHKSFEGKQHSEETKKLMSEKAKAKTPEQNSQYGTCWITRDGENKKIKKEDLDLFISEGWSKGRKILNLSH